MNSKGIWQLRKITLYYCPWGGSSEYMRTFIQHTNNGLAAYARRNPQVVFHTYAKKRIHPHIVGEFVNGHKIDVSVKNQPWVDIEKFMTRMRNQVGRHEKHQRLAHFPLIPSVQGTVNPWLPYEGLPKAEFGEAVDGELERLPRA
eukprot:gnl/Spiro4/13470_TR7179_c0_g11_i1.p2 gnl/Spiro4/13470_TR7179_c0_g11~~gnl/Spiro4/13470_TR7179_c0_g11_i1.p2  ORF type:complete len:156 (-),score=48.26 gnl/Spiro4/13470_TR7179_c0_g11_i1:75-509(-)